ncbi:hypothetical protein BN1723_015146 [Verticillium longisporum]|uniref:Uncharacterized protein n=1 Tax=Verticillium longisporum TaxID=100787 RepID=A0A0G4MRU2_VERLO|nr:hypothetical protein BN1723_015146 [Verticillium longisporum]
MSRMGHRSRSASTSEEREPHFSRFTGPAGLVALRIPKHFLEAVYGITIRTRALEEGGAGKPTASELLRAYARARGYQTQGLGQPDESRAARYILKDYVAGKLLFCQPPPNTIDAKEFNSELYDDEHLPEHRRGHLVPVMEDLSIAGDDESTMASEFVALPAGDRTEADGPLVEAPDIVRLEDGTYVLFFSSWCYASDKYNIKYAVSRRVEGPYIRSLRPLLQTGDYGLKSPGGATSIINGGQMVFHANCDKGRCLYATRYAVLGLDAII